MAYRLRALAKSAILCYWYAIGCYNGNRGFLVIKTAFQAGKQDNYQTYKIHPKVAQRLVAVFNSKSSMKVQLRQNKSRNEVI